MASESEKGVKKIIKRKAAKIKKNKEEIKEEIKKEEVKEVKKEEATEVKKKRRKYYSNKDTITIMILSIIIGALFGGAITRFLCDRKYPKGLDDFDRIFNDIYDNKYGNTSRSVMLNSSVNGLLNSLNDRYAYIDETKNAMLLYDQETTGEFIGMGVNNRIDESGKIQIQSVFENSPASKAGIEPGDIIVKLNDNYYDSSNYDAFSYSILSSSAGDKVKVELLRNKETIVKEFELDKIVVDSVGYYVEEKGNLKVGVFRIENFADNTYKQFKDKYEKAVEDGIGAIVLDLRSNNEGLMENAEKIASMFLDKGTIIYQTFKNGEYTEIVSDSKKEINLPVAVVVDGSTISTGEMLASTLNENLGAPIVGVSTYGKGYIQKVVPLYDEYAVIYSVKEWVTSNKNKIEESGIAPTIEVQQSEEQQTEEQKEADESIKKAIESINVMYNYD